MSVPNLSSAQALIAGALGLPTDAIPQDAGIGTFEPWDSLGHLRVILAIEEVLGHQLDAGEIIEIEGLPDVARILSC